MTDQNTYHVMPVDDVFEHEYEDCACVPFVEAVKREEGSVG